jgi:hypothetical protein
MQIRKGKPPGTSRLAGSGAELSREARIIRNHLKFRVGPCDFGLSLFLTTDELAI